MPHGPDNVANVVVLHTDEHAEPSSTPERGCERTPPVLENGKLSALWPLAWTKHSFLHPVTERSRLRSETTKERPQEQTTTWTGHFRKVLWLLPATSQVTELWS